MHHGWKFFDNGANGTGSGLLADRERCWKLLLIGVILALLLAVSFSAPAHAAPGGRRRALWGITSTAARQQRPKTSSDPNIALLGIGALTPSFRG